MSAVAPGAALEEPGDHVVEGIDQPQRQVGFDLGRDVDQVFLVVAGQEHDLDARAACRQDLFPNAADRQDPARERDLAGHGEIGLDGRVAEQADQSGGDGHARGWPILGDGPRRDVNMEVGLVETRDVERRAALA